MIYELFFPVYRTHINYSFTEYVIKTSNVKPFYTIVTYIKAVQDGSMNLDIPIRNMLGNLLLFVPYAYFYYIWKKPDPYQFLLSTTGILLATEVLQMALRVGFFDIDDILLRLAGAAAAYYILRSCHGRKKADHLN